MQPYCRDAWSHQSLKRQGKSLLEHSRGTQPSLHFDFIFSLQNQRISFCCFKPLDCGALCYGSFRKMQLTFKQCSGQRLTSQYFAQLKIQTSLYSLPSVPQSCIPRINQLQIVQCYSIYTEKNLCISVSAQFKPILLKSHL